MSDRQMCTLTLGCGFPAHRAEDHPCGQPARVGDPCWFCGDPIRADGLGHPVPCPRCWRPVTIADIKAFAAEEGFVSEVTLGKGVTDA